MLKQPLKFSLIQKILIESMCACSCHRSSGTMFHMTCDHKCCQSMKLCFVCYLLLTGAGREMLSGSNLARADVDILDKMTQLPVLRDETASQTGNQVNIPLLMSETAIVSITV